MGQININMSGSFPLATQEFSAEEGGHAMAISSIQAFDSRPDFWAVVACQSDVLGASLRLMQSRIAPFALKAS